MSKAAELDRRRKRILRAKSLREFSTAARGPDGRIDPADILWWCKHKRIRV